MAPLQLYGSVGPEEDNKPDDVASVGNSLVELGLAGARAAARSGLWDNRLDATVKSYQGANGLDVDGVLVPGGPTQQAINQSIEKKRGEAQDAFQPFTFDGASAVLPDEERVGIGGGAEPAHNSSLDLNSDRYWFGENIGNRERFAPRDEDRNWRQGDSAFPRLGDSVAKAIAAGVREREAQFDNVLKMLGGFPTAPAPAVARASEAAHGDESEHILTARGYRYAPDPMGRVGWGDWVDGQGRPLDPRSQREIIERMSKDPGGVETSEWRQDRTQPGTTDDYLDALEAMLEDGVVPTSDGRQLLELFAQILIAQRGYGAKTLRLKGSLHGRNTYPPELGRRIDLMTNDGCGSGFNKRSREASRIDRIFVPMTTLYSTSLGRRKT